MVCHLSLFLPTATSSPSLCPSFSLLFHFRFLLTWKIWDSPTAVWMGASVLSTNHVGAILERPFIQSFVLLCGLGFCCCCLFYLFFFLLCALRGKHTFRSISRFYLNVVLRVNFLYWSLYWWVHATGNKVLYKRSNQNHCALLRPCLSWAFCPPHRRLSDWTK